jgi:secondary thiamine-phosphate synthase enzyme
MTFFLKLQTKKKLELLNLTSAIQEIVDKSKVKDGICFIFLLHSSAGLLINEDEEGLKKDWFLFFENISSKINFFHNLIDNNALAHLISGILGQSRFIFIKDGKLLLGRWQQIFLVEADGPREREIAVKIIKTQNS